MWCMAMFESFTSIFISGLTDDCWILKPVSALMSLVEVHEKSLVSHR